LSIARPFRELTLIQATKAGMIVAKQKGNQNKDIARLAAEVIGKWKRAVQIQQAEAKKQKMSGSSPPKAEAASSPAPASKGDKYTGDVSKRRWETDKVDTKRTGVPTRDACIGLIYNGLAFMSDASPTQVIAKAMEVEKAAYELYKGDNSDYRAKLRSLFQNLKNIRGYSSI
jgi:transcription elongation factor S-II